MPLILDFSESVALSFRARHKPAVEMLVIDPVHPVFWVQQSASKLIQELSWKGVLLSEKKST